VFVLAAGDGGRGGGFEVISRVAPSKWSI
jgi:hypothetical protein